MARPEHGPSVRDPALHRRGVRSIPTGGTLASVNPFTGEIIAEVSRGDAEDVDRAVAAARKCLRDGAWRGMRPRERKEVLCRFADLIAQNVDQFAVIDTLDMGKPIAETTTLDVPIAVASSATTRKPSTSSTDS